jgi:hypothetical protein
VYLSAHSVVFEIDFPLVWQQKLQIKPMAGLTAEICERIQIYHRVNFYRENILDLTKEFHFEQILLMVGPPPRRSTPTAAATSSTTSPTPTPSRTSSSSPPTPRTNSPTARWSS